MGQRANFVIVENGKRSLYYDHWCANRIDTELFWGPEIAIEFVKLTESVVEPDGWLDEIWCEGGAVINVDSQELLWFGGEDIEYDVEMRRTHDRMMKTQWPGWKLVWACEGICEIAEYLDLERELVVKPTEPDHEFCVIDEYPQDNNLLLSVVMNGSLKVGQIHGDEESLECGLNQIEFLLKCVSSEHLTWNGEFPRFGIHLDCDHKSLSFWSGSSVGSSIGRIPECWSGWKVYWLKDNFERHLEIINESVTLPHRSENQLRDSVFQILSGGVHTPKSNPARELGPTVGAEWVNPWSDISRASAGSMEHKLRVIEELKEKFQEGAPGVG